MESQPPDSARVACARDGGNPQVSPGWVQRGRAVRSRVLQWVGIPTCVGIGPTKTLANHIAKSAERKPGSYSSEFAQVANLAVLPVADLEALMAATPLEEIWGVGPAHRCTAARRRPSDGA